MTALNLDRVSEDFLMFCWSNLPPRDRARVMAGSPKTAWLFGAGASHHYNLNAAGVPVPLANGFFEAFHEVPTSQGFHAYVGPFISYLGHYRSVRAKDVPRWRENIQDFMTSIEADIAQLTAKKRAGELDPEDMSKGYSLASVFNNLGFILASVVNETQNGPSESLYRYLLDFCGRDDAFITFNWDTLLDRALVDSGGWSRQRWIWVAFCGGLGRHVEGRGRRQCTFHDQLETSQAARIDELARAVHACQFPDLRVCLFGAAFGSDLLVLAVGVALWNAQGAVEGRLCHDLLLLLSSQHTGWILRRAGDFRGAGAYVRPGHAEGSFRAL